MKQSIEHFGHMDDGREVNVYHISSPAGTKISLINFGATLVSCNVKGLELCLGLKDWQSYKEQRGYMGSTCGRFSNRIAQAEFALGAKVYRLSKNHGRHSLHGGKRSFSVLYWDGKIIQNASGVGVRFSLKSPNGDEGYPGDLSAGVDYMLTADNCLLMHYRATLEGSASPINLTNHAYWNLAGEGAGSIEDQHIRVAAHRYVDVDEESIPTGRLLEVEGEMDMRSGEAQLPGSYDHCYVLDKTQAIFQPKQAELWKNSAAEFSGEDLLSMVARLKPTFAAKAWCTQKNTTLHNSKGELSMEVYTTYPGLQLYTGKFLNEPNGRNGNHFRQHSAFCLETQYFPDSPNQQDNSNFPNCILKPGELYEELTIHRFLY